MAGSTTGSEVFLLEFASQLDVPIVSIDYSLAPEAPYPRAIEEVFYAYCWTLKNHEYFGTKLDKIVMFGESAGSSILKAVIIKCIQNNIRLPNRFVSMYGVCSVSFDTTPSRCLSIFDTMLYLKFKMRLLTAYVYGTEKCASENDDNDSEFDIDLPNNDPLLCPMNADDEILKKFPPITFAVGSIDPLLDDNIAMAKRLKSLKVEGIKVKVFKGLPHGFVTFNKVIRKLYDIIGSINYSCFFL